MIEWAWIVVAYLLGSVSSAIVVCRLAGLPDPRGKGSGNPGATNVLRVGGRLPAALTLAGDFLKGAIPVWLALGIGIGPAVVGASGFAAFLGHLYPVFFGFRGGKGVATGLGVLLGWSPLALAATVATWLLVAALFRISSLAALVAFLLAPLYVGVLTGMPALALATAAMTVLVWWRHRGNIRRIVAGEEARIGG
ncbi:glycerol-3-phosphate 1-O-acyltransferase PlsY [Arhodomonas sp. SL1]|uniref:glycerol-3-phosphate 1-O-acyltransferase PlsY n=1 Tax=Arhodomonas sp. SL1 TaxID=3425691 RepID=UPI003F883370